MSNTSKATIAMIPNGDDQLWERTYRALVEARWADARKMLDTLNSEHSACAVDMLPHMAQLWRMGVTLPMGDYSNVIGDRIDLWNRHVDRRALLMSRKAS